MPFAERLAAIRARITRACEACGREPSTVELLPVSKHHPVSALQEAMGLGFRRFGENYVQEAAEKAPALPESELVLIGPLQRNKARQALQVFREIQSVDRRSLAERLARIAQEEGLTRPVWVQVDLWGEATKEGGCPAEDLPDLLACVADCPALPLQGFMAIPPPEHPEAFVALSHIRQQWEDRLGRRLRLSMGMSGDLEAAIGAGSDQVRIGTALFGARA